MEDEEINISEEEKEEGRLIYESYIEGKLSISQIAKKFKRTSKEVENIVKNYAIYILKDDTEYKKAKKKREDKIKKEKLEKQKKAAEELEKKRKDEEERKKQDEIDEAVILMRAFLNFDLDQEEFCNRENLSYRDFDEKLDLVYEGNKRIYYDVNIKIYNDELDKKRNEENKIKDEKGYEESVQNAKFDLRDYIASAKSMNDIQDFQNKLLIIRHEDYVLYKKAYDKSKEDILNSTILFKSVIKKVGEYIKKGVYDKKTKKKRAFTILDYYKTTRINYNELVNMAKNYNMEKELELLSDFSQKNTTDFEDINITTALGKDKSADNVKKVNAIFSYMRANNYPMLKGIYNNILESKNFDFSKTEKKTEIDTMLVDELNRKNKNTQMLVTRVYEDITYKKYSTKSKMIK